MSGFSGYEIFWPVGAHVILVYALYGLLRIRRVRLVRAGKVAVRDYAENRGEPKEGLVVNNCIANQFELPVLFYLCAVLTYITEADNMVSVTLAWLFVLLRYAHAYVHVTNNRVLYRSSLFMAGFVVLGIMWVWLFIWMATSP